MFVVGFSSGCNYLHDFVNLFGDMHYSSLAMIPCIILLKVLHLQCISHYTFMHFVEVDYLKQCSYIRLYFQLIPF